MLRYGIILLSALFYLSATAQHLNPAEIEPDSSNYENIYLKKISEDSLHSTYIIWIKIEVKPHYHASHTEQVYVLDGKATMTLGDSTFEISKGDLILIPKGTVHSVITNSEQPLKILSFQSPRFDGDRIMVNKLPAKQ